ncbi:hypothetical protein GS490_13490 [Rhodococcus hoagii]|nr:hypothetical protein [Prescottella equi]
MSTRDELADLIRTAFYRDGGNCDEVADAILAAGFIKAVREEVRHRVVGTGLLIGDPWRSVESARDAVEYINAQGMYDKREVVRRRIGPWEVA